MRSAPCTTTRSEALRPAATIMFLASSGSIRTGLGSKRSGATCTQTSSRRCCSSPRRRAERSDPVRPAALDEHGDRLADAKPRRRFRNGKMNHRRVLPQGAAGSEIGQRNEVPSESDAVAWTEPVGIKPVVGQCFDPEILEDRRFRTERLAAGRPDPAPPWPL